MRDSDGHCWAWWVCVGWWVSHKLSKNVWFVWSKSGDVTDLDGQTNTQQGKVELVSFWSVRIWVSQYITWNGNSERPQFTSSLTMWPFYSIKRGVILCKRWIMYKHTFYCFFGQQKVPWNLYFMRVRNLEEYFLNLLQISWDELRGEMGKQGNIL